MNKIKKDFSVPYYIFEEIVEYVELRKKEKNKSMKWSNIRALLKLAIVSNSLTKEEAQYIEKTFCRE